MNINNVAIAEAYYKAMGEKDLESIGKYLHPDVQFIGPLAKKSGKEDVLEAAKNFCVLFKTVTIRAKLGEGNVVMLVNDLEFPDPVGMFPTAVLMRFQEGLIERIELFYDPRPLLEHKDKIFS